MSGWNSETKSLKYLKTKKIYKNSTGSCVFSADDKTAYSYTHWCFLKTIKGKLVFNDYNYSTSTSSHQSCVRELLKELKIKVDFTVYQRQGLDNGIQIDHLLEKIELAKFRLTKKGLQKKTIQNLQSDLKDAETELNKIKKALKISVPRKLLKEIKAKVESDEKYRLESARNSRAKRAPLDPELKQKLASLDSVDLLETMNKSDDLGAIEL